MQANVNNIYIIGSGAIGKALAVFLKLAGRSVTLIRGSVDDGSSKTKSFQVVLEDGTIKEATVEVRTIATVQTLKGIIVLATKSFGNERLANALKEKIGDSPIVLLQNGLGVEQSFLQGGYTEVYRCVLFVTSQFVNDISVRFKPVSVCPIGVIKGNNKNLDSIVGKLHTSDFQFKAENNIQTVIWKKAIINSVFNSICPLLDTDNGIFYRDKNALEIARRIIGECLAVAGEKGIALEQGEVEASLLQISNSSEGQLISTLQDIKNRRKTEIETLNFEILKVARSLNKEDAVRETQVLGELTRLKANLNIHN